jgi:hypothetical protein
MFSSNGLNYFIIYFLNFYLSYKVDVLKFILLFLFSIKSEHVKKKRLIDWCLTSTLAVFQLSWCEQILY